MRVKICGLTRAEDAQRAEVLGAWALGFIFYPKSKRFIDAGLAKDIIKDLQTQAVGVFVNQTDEALDIAAKIGLRGIQLHGDETPQDCARVKKEFDGIVIKAFRPEKSADLLQISEYWGDIDYALLDAGTGGQYGGTGHTMDWDLAAKAGLQKTPVILAGGLNPDNIAAAVEKVKPFAADLSSGVESVPGVKDKAKLDALFGAINGVT